MQQGTSSQTTSQDKIIELDHSKGHKNNSKTQQLTMKVAKTFKPHY
jgi:hypothetical protein